MVPPKCSAIALARGACTGVLMIRTSVAEKTASKAAVNLVSRSRIRNRKRRPASSRSMSRFAGQLGQPGAGRVGGDPEDVHPAGGVLDDEEDIQPAQGDGVEVKQIAGQDSVRLGSQELCPRGSAPTRRRVDAGAVQDLPDGGGADLVAKADEFAVDASVAPGGVLSGQADDQSAHAGGNGGSTGPGRLGRPAAGEELSVPAQDRARCDEQPELAADGEQSAESGDHGSVGPAHKRPWRPPSQHGELVAEDEDLDLLAGVGSAA